MCFFIRFVLVWLHERATDWKWSSARRYEQGQSVGTKFAWQSELDWMTRSHRELIKEGKLRVHIGVGRADWLRLPLPPNRAGGSPAHGSPVDGSPPRGLNGLCMGCCQAEQPALGKVGIGPALVIAAPAPAPAAMTLAQYGAQAHADPAV